MTEGLSDMADTKEGAAQEAVRTAKEAGWHISRYNLSAPVPGKSSVAIANLYKGICAEYSPVELYLLSVLDGLREDHPIIDRLAKRGVITRIDEHAALEAMGRMACAAPMGVSLTLCPTMNCNFDCPYCFERHRPGKMSQAVQDDVVALAERMMDFSGGKRLFITWFGGEPLLAADVIESLSERLIALAEKRGAEYSAGIITNGYLLTQKNADMLARCRVRNCQVTIDGMGATHDATRHLAGGGATFGRIVENLRTVKMPFRINIRQNVQESNLGEVPEVREFIRKLGEESGNEIVYGPAPVSGNEATEERGGRVGLLCGTDLSEIGLIQEAARFSAGRGHYCGANVLMATGVDEEGRLFKCWEAAGIIEEAFGYARDWDPKDPLNTAFEPGNLTKYLNTALPNGDAECSECVWLPLCAGGCPYRRLNEGKSCIPFRNQPERYVLALHARIGEDKGRKPDEQGKGTDPGQRPSV